MDKSSNHKLVSYLRQLGLSDDQAQAYIYLQEHGPSTVLEISRGIDTGRTKLYPALLEMIDKQIVGSHEKHYGTTYEALEPANIGFMVDHAEAHVTNLRGGLARAVEGLGQIRRNASTTQKIIEYSGIEGLKQACWTSMLRAKKECRVYELMPLRKFRGMNAQFIDRLDKIVKERQITIKILTNNIDGYSDSPLITTRSIDKKVFTIGYQVYIYDNVVTIVSHSNNEIRISEIHAPLLADHYTQMFDLLWGTAINPVLFKPR